MMTLNRKITLLLITVACGILAIFMLISVYAFRHLSIASSTAHVQTVAEIVRVLLTESMINGVIAKREQSLERLRDIRDLRTVRVVRSKRVNEQFGDGLAREMVPDEIEASVLADGRPRFELMDEEGQPVFRGTIPYVASSRGTPNCLQCHQVAEGTVLGAVTIELSLTELRRQAVYGALAVLVAVSLISLFAILGARRLMLPVGDTATAIGTLVQAALRGDFKGRVQQRTKDDIGDIAAHANQLLSFLDEGLSQISARVTQLTGRPPKHDENQLLATIDMIDGLADATRFKATIEEDETKTEIYERFGLLLGRRFGVEAHSIYEAHGPKQLTTISVDGEIGGACRWCDPQILVRSEMCRAKRSGHPVDAFTQPGLCFAFRAEGGDAEADPWRHYCLPLIQSGGVGCIVQLVARESEAAARLEQIPYIQVYLREMAPVLEAKRLTETLRDSSLRDAMTDLNNRRFLEQYVDTLIASARRRNSPLALLMIDLDYFKMVNDSYGHDVGDSVLKGLADVLKQSVRTSDILVRFGGEEFLIVLQEADGDNAVMVAEKIRARVADFKFHIAGGMLQKTVSIGVAVFPDDSETFWQTLKYADVALYRAKDDGRNRVVRFTPEMWGDDTVAY
ncbi:GGDEF domain-containing protein [Thiocystis violacea]|uniref:GGDEF domain-containing protein n=1 Tax=Thiocystis violacea TaxID=13725 RepID=UPI001F5BD605|nr:GGDEF domain-containing protein [Thiocystis violacea]